MKILGWFAASLLVWSTHSVSAGPIVDQSHDIFFPKNMVNVAEPFERFPVFWWNFLVFKSDPKKLLDDRQSVCSFLKNEKAVTASGCRGSLDGYRPVLESWLKDYPVRADIPSHKEWLEKVEQARAQATLPGSRELLWLLRIDPLQTYLDLKKRVETNLSGVEKQLALVTNESQGQWILPVQFEFAPSKTAFTEKFVDRVRESCGSCEDLHMLGPHMSVLENESRVKKDLTSVNFVGVIVFVVLTGALFWVRRARLLLIILPLAFSILLGAVVTVLVYGSIHGLTLAFGTGLVGLAVDYGLHSAFWRQSWRPNFFGLLTTVVVFATCAISEIPLLRQMMFFGAVGVSLAFGILYLLFRFNEEWFTVQPFKLTPKPSPLKLVLVGICCSGIFLVFLVKPSFSLRQFDFQSAQTKQLQPLLKAAFANRRPVVEVLSSSNVLEESHRRLDFALKNEVEIESVSKYLPMLSKQEQNLRSWKEDFCPNRRWRGSSDVEDFAQPVFTQFECQNLKPQELDSAPAYLRHLQNGQNWVHMWFPSSTNQSGAIKAEFPTAVAVDEIAEIFAKALSDDLLLILPIAILGVLFLLILEFRNWKMVIMASVPVFSGVGLVLWFFALMGWPISFMCLIGIVMVCGFAVDYGIFVTDAIERRRMHNPDGLWSALAMCAVCTMAGFLPMTFGHHPVLQHLGFSLLIGSVGTYVGTIWGVEGCAKFIFKMKDNR